MKTRNEQLLHLVLAAPLSRLDPRAEVGLLAYSFILLFQLPPPDDSPTLPYLASPLLDKKLDFFFLTFLGINYNVLSDM